MEVEAKFLVPDEETLARLIEVASLAGYDVEPGEARRDVDTFLDTADRRLLTAGFYFRRRETTDGVRLTLKKLVAPSDGVLRREEIEALVAADVPVAEWPSRAAARTRGAADGRGAAGVAAHTRADTGRAGRPAWPAGGRRAQPRPGDRERARRRPRLARGRGRGARPGRRRGRRRARGRAPRRVGSRARGPRQVHARSRAGRRGRRRSAHRRRRASPCTRRTPRARAPARAARRRCWRSIAVSSQVEAGRVAGLSDRRVRYWLARYRVEGTGIYDDEAVDPGAAQPAAGPGAQEAAGHLSRRHHDRGGGRDPALPPRQDARARGGHPAGRGPGGAARHARLDAAHAHGAPGVRRLPRPRRDAAGAEGAAPHRPDARRRARPRRVQREDPDVPRRPARRARRRPRRPARSLAGRARQTTRAPRHLPGRASVPALRREDHGAARGTGRGSGAADGHRPPAAARGPGAARRPLQGHGRGLGVRGPARRARDAAASLPRAAQGVQGTALHARVLRGRARAGRPPAHQARQGPPGPPRRPAGRRRDQRHPARLPHVGHVAARGARPARSRRGHRGAGRGAVLRGARGGDGAPRAHLPGGLARRWPATSSAATWRR